MKRFVYTLILSILMSTSYYKDVDAEEYTKDTADCFSLDSGTNFFCFDRKTGYGITGTYKQIVDGRLNAEISFKDGNRDGIQTRYYRNGKIKFTEEYKNGVLHGTVTSYNENGKVEASVVYKDGKQIK